MTDTLKYQKTDIHLSPTIMFHSKFCSLSLRERQVVVLCGTGVSTDNIAKQLHVSKINIDQVINTIRLKMKFVSNDEYNQFLSWASSYINMT